MVSVVARMCSTTWMTEVRVKVKFLGMPAGEQEMEELWKEWPEGGRRTRSALGTGQAGMSVSRLVNEGLVTCRYKIREKGKE